jgi:hypothetical protein
MCSGFLCHGLWSDEFDFMAAFMVSSLWIGPGFIFEL